MWKTNANDETNGNLFPTNFKNILKLYKTKKYVI